MCGSPLGALYAIMKPLSKGRSLYSAVCDGYSCAGYAIQMSDFQKRERKSFTRRQILTTSGSDAIKGVLLS